MGMLCKTSDEIQECAEGTPGACDMIGDEVREVSFDSTGEGISGDGGSIGDSPLSRPIECSDDDSSRDVLGSGCSIRDGRLPEYTECVDSGGSEYKGSTGAWFSSKLSDGESLRRTGSGFRRGLSVFIGI